MGPVPGCARRRDGHQRQSRRRADRSLAAAEQPRRLRLDAAALPGHPSGHAAADKIDQLGQIDRAVAVAVCRSRKSFGDEIAEGRASFALRHVGHFQGPVGGEDPEPGIIHPADFFVEQ